MSVYAKQYKNVGKNYFESIDGDEYWCPVVDGKEYSHIGETEDIALLIGLGIKYDGLHSQFPRMAARMLNIKSAWVV